MRILSIKKFVLLALTINFSAQIISAQTKPLYRLPDSIPEQHEGTQSEPYLIGNDNGLYRMLPSGITEPLWTGGKVTQILKTDYSDSNNKRGCKWFFLTSKGIITSYDLMEFTESNDGIPYLTLKEYDGETKRLVKQVSLLKDICADPFDQNTLVTATKDNVYLSRDSGTTWKSIGSMSTNTSGIKAVAVTHIPVKDKNGNSKTTLVVLMSHPIFGLSYIFPDDRNPQWTDVEKGMKNMQSVTYADEISDILPVAVKNKNGSYSSEVYFTQSFLPCLYRMDWSEEQGICLYEDNEPLETLDSLFYSDNSIFFCSTGKIKCLSLSDNSVTDINAQDYSSIAEDISRLSANTVYIPGEKCGLSNALQMSELWLVRPDVSLAQYADKALDRRAVYIPANHVTSLKGINEYKKTILKNNLNALVVDMKDDYGLLRFEPKNELVKNKCYVSKYKIDIEQFVKEFKKDDIYLIARIVVFKDKHLATEHKEYAVWNSSTNTSWDGIKGTENVYDKDGNFVKKQTVYYDEKWVDPYSEEVWEYNVNIAKDLIDYGFDEIQFDYIRFPTDGKNMNQAQFRWKDNGMDKESAIMSFLSYARKNINAPLGIDIYGANGWYRSGTRTGQDVELLSDYVDVICPMFYPSHFEQSFLNYKPYEERPYRIYYYGTYRNTVIGRNHIIVRPWVQAFYLGVTYDQKYYDTNYVKREVYGVRDSVNRGYMFWNNTGRYDDISPAPGNEKYPWASFEASQEYRKPAFSSDDKSFTVADKPITPDDITSILDTVLYKVIEEETPAKKRKGLFLHVLPIGNYSDD